MRAARRPIGALLLLLALSGCTSPGPVSATPPSVTTDAEAPIATPSVEPVLVPGGGAEENRAFFDRVNTEVVAASAEAGGTDFSAALASAGFPAEAVEVTADTTSVGLEADSVQFAVRMGPGCLIGQYGPKSGGYHSVVAAPLATGRCLVGGAGR